MMSAFKDILQRDNVLVFLNPNEFGEEHIVGKKRMVISIDNNEMVEREKRQAGAELYRQGIYKKKVLFYVQAKDFGPLPAVGKSLALDGETYIIIDAVDEGGIYSIIMEAVRS